MTSANLIFSEKTLGAPFEHWASNVKSSGGKPVMALQIGPRGWAPASWRNMSPQDLQWLQGLVSLLPILWATLDSQAAKLKKGWPTFVQAATDLRAWSKLPVHEAAVPANALETEPITLSAPEAVPSKPRLPRKPSTPVKRKTQEKNATNKAALLPIKAKAQRKKTATVQAKTHANQSIATTASKDKKGAK